MGEMAVAQGEGLLRTLLGSCLGVALYDRRLKIAGLAHVVLPHSQGTTELPGKFADTAIPELLRRLAALAGGESLKLTAKLAGGANMFTAAGAPGTIGEQNAAAVEDVLAAQRIPIVARHLGGEQGRRMTLDTTSGQVTIEIVGSESLVM
jgi:chemotaxis protein CheD